MRLLIRGRICHNKAEEGRAFTKFKNPVHAMDVLIEEIKRGNCKGRSNLPLCILSLPEAGKSGIEGDFHCSRLPAPPSVGTGAGRQG